MNKLFLITAIFGLHSLSFGQIAVGTSNPENSAAFEVYSTTKGFLPPRMSQVQLTSISSPVEGLLIYCTDCTIKGLYIHSGTDFVNTLTGNSLNFYLLNTIVEGSTNPPADGTPSLEQLIAFGITDLIESQTYYEEAIADASPTPTSLSELQAIIQNANIDLPPVITSSNTANPIAENSGAGQEIYTVTASDYLGINNYAITGTDASAFTIDENTGVVTLTGTPDFELQNSYTFEVTASDAAGNNSEPQMVSLAITDLDEEAPAITSEATANTIVENSGAGQEIYTVTASDNIGIDSYTINGTHASAFTIDENTGVVTLTGNPDFEAQESYTFEVTASDAAGNNSVPQMVSLAITDLDEEAPAITSEAIANPIAENSGAGQEIYTVTASDNIGIDSYTINGTHASAFTIDENTGVVTLTGNPDFEAQESYTFEVTASDAAGNTSVQQNVSLAITDVDDEAPIITSSNTANPIAENSGAGQEIYTVIATDNVGVTSYAIGGIDASAFSINENTGNVVLIANPDVSIKFSYSFEITATDLKNNKSVPFLVSLLIIEQDNINPVITSKAEVSIEENIGAEQDMYIATAEDNVGVTSFAIGGTDANAFTIDANTGVVTLTGNPDFEIQNSYTFEVTASDAIGNTSNPFTVSLSIIDLDEFNTGVAWGQVRYIMFRGTDANGIFNNIGELDILDTDGNNLIENESLNESNFSYFYGGGYFSTQYGARIFDNSQSSAYANASFSLDNGEKWVLIDLNQIVEVGSLKIQARSNSSAHIERINHMTVFTSDRKDTGFAYTGTPRGDNNEDFLLGKSVEEMKKDVTLNWRDLTELSTITSSFTYESSIKHVDFTAPIITSGTSAFSLFSNSGAVQEIYTAAATDDQSVTSYTIGGNDASAFTIDTITGVVILQANPNIDVQDTYTFEVTARDAAGNSSTPQTVSLSILDENDLDPVITSGNTANTIEENSGAGQKIYTVTTSHYQDVTNYSIGGTDASSFTINANTGIVTLLDNPDFETQESYTFEVTARDISGITNSPFVVNLPIIDLDDEMPVITSIASATITEESGPEQEVYTATADDNVGVTSFAIGGTDANAFTIDANTGVVTLIDDPDFELQNSYTFEVTASDATGNTSNPLTMNLSIIDLVEFNTGVAWGQVRYIMFRGTDANGIFNNIGELDILDTDGNNLIENGSLNESNFSYFYGGGHFSTQYGASIFDNSQSSAYANASFSLDNGEKWVLIDLNQIVEVGSLTIQARSNSSAHIERINHMTVYASDRNDTGFEYTGTPSGNGDEDLLLGTTKEQMKADATLKWRDLTEFTTTNASITYESSNQQMDFTAPIITSGASALSIFSESGLGQQVYTATATDNVGVTNFVIGGNDASAFNIDANSGVVTLVDNPILATKASYSFEVTANDARGNTSAPIIVSFSIIDENDLNPVITSGNTADAIEENSGAEQQIYTVTTSHFQDITNYAIGGTDASSFTINANTGIVTLMENPEFETQESYSFEVTARDTDGNSSTPQTVNLTITDLDDQAPVITSSNSANTIEENSGAGQQVYSVTASDNETVTRYVISGTDANSFIINANTGVVTLLENPDFESQESYSFEVTASDAAGNSNTPFTVNLSIIDLDDINLGVAWGQVRYIMFRGTNDNGIENSIPELDIFNSSGDNLIDNGTLDKTKFTFSYGGGYKSNSSGVKIFDNSQYNIYSNNSFSKSSGEKWVLIDLIDTVEIGSLELLVGYTSNIAKMKQMTVFVSDRNDTGFSYSGTENTNNENEDLLLGTSIDEMKTDPSLRWSDLGENVSLSKDIITSCNSGKDLVKPIITSSTTAKSLFENSGAGQNIYTATASDNLGVMSYEISGLDANALNIDANTGVVSLIANPIKATKEFYNFVVTAKDYAGNTSLPNNVFFAIIDSDDEAPIITSSEIANSIEENCGPEKQIYTVTATDNVGVTSYAIAGTDANAFNIDANTGLVTLVANPDFETQESYTFEVFAIDAWDNQSSSITVSLTITDIEIEAPPLITSSSTADEILENTGAGQQVYSTTTSHYQEITSYTIGGADSSAFTIDQNTGIVTLIANPDFEMQDSYSFEVTATDAKGDESITKTVGLYIIDEYDINTLANWGQVRYLMLRGTDDNNLLNSVGGLAIFNPLGENLISNGTLNESEFTYHYGGGYSTGSSGNNLFENQANNAYENNTFSTNNGEKWILIDLQSTVEIGSIDVQTKSNSTSHIESISHMTLFASDRRNTGFEYSGTEIGTENEDLLLGTSIDEMKLDPTLKWRNLNEFTTSNTSIKYGFANQEINTVDDEWGEVRYIMFRGTEENNLYNNVGELDLFDVDGVNIIDNGTLAESNFTYSYGGGYFPEASGIDLFDNEPSDAYANNTFSNNDGQKWILIDLNETIEIGTLTVQARSNSSDHIDRIKHMSIFTSDRKDTGLSFTGTEINTENEDLVLSHTITEMKADLTLKWFDLTAISSTNTSIGISKPKTALDMEIPIISSGNIAFSLFDNSGAGQPVYTATATDNVGVTNYAIGGTDANEFTIDTNTGIVTLLENPILASQELYSFEVTASDASGNTSNPTEVIFTVIYIDEIEPVITSSGSISIDENIGAEQEVYSVTAIDNVGVTSYVIGGQDASVFTINTNTGIMTLDQNPDFETQESYTFEVTAMDASGNSSNPFEVNLTVHDLDDEAPVITSAASINPIEENSGSNQHVYTITATDNIGITSYNIGGTDASAFTVDENTGEVNLLVNPDFENQESYIFEVFAIDSIGNTNDGFVINLQIIDLDDEAPEITSGETANPIAENSGEEQEVYTASASDNSGVVANYQMGGTDATFFSINENTGVVTLSADPNYELKWHYNFEVTASDVAGNTSDPISVSLSVIDVEELESNWGQVRYIVLRGEDANGIYNNVGEIDFFGRDGANLMDNGTLDDNNFTYFYGGGYFSTQYGERLFDNEVSSAYANNTSSLNSGQKWVLIDLQSTVEIGSIEISSRSSSDAHIERISQMTLFTSDRLDTGFEYSGSITEDLLFELSINQMKLDPTLKWRDLNEFTSTNTTINYTSGNQEITNTYNNEWGQVQYIMFRGTEDNSLYNNIGEIDILDTNGVNLINNGTLDVNDFTYRYGGGYYAEASGIDLFDNEPSEAYANNTFSNNNGEKWILINLNKTVTVGTLSVQARSNSASHIDRITHITVFASERNDIGFAFTGSETNDENENLTLGTRLSDMKQDPSLKWRDLNEFTSTNLTVNLTSAKLAEDYNAPIITSGITANSIFHNTGAGQLIYTVTATDQIGVTSFAISGTDANAFTIDENTGQVYLVANPNSSTKAFYNFEVTANDANGNTSDPKNVNLVILNIEDFVITSGSSAYSVFDNSGAGQQVYTVTATENVEVTNYTIEGTDANAFTIDANTGVVTLLANPDFSTKNSYSFDVTASSAQGITCEPLNVSLAIINEGELNPVITSASSANTIDEHSGANQQIYTVICTHYQDVTSYAIEGTDASAFTIDANTGVVTLLSDPDFEMQESYTFAVTASDLDGNTSDPFTVSLTITDLDDINNESDWGMVRYIMFRGEDDKDPLETYLFNNVGELDILDTDGNNLIDNNTLNKNNFEYSYGGGFYSGQSGSDLFVNNPSEAYGNNLTSASANTAEKWVLIDLNQTIEVGSLTIQSRSNSETHKARIEHITLFTSDRDDTGFTFTGTPTGNKDEDLLLGTTKEQMKADATLKWRDLTEFTTTNTSITYENANQQLDLTIPIVTSATFTFNVINNSGAGQQVYTATATDNVGVTNFVIGGNDASAFNIDANSGVVTLVDNPILATKASYSFEVTANDARGNTSAPISVSFSIIDENDLNPVITSGNSTNAIVEDSGTGQEVYTLTTTHYQDVTSYVIGGTDASSFSIDQNTGVVTFLVNPDFETKYSYNFNVTASDADGNSSTTNTIVLNIIDLDDEAPIITSSLVANSIDENSGAGQIVYTATATDNIGVTSYAIGEISATLKEYDEFGNTYRVTNVSIDDNSTFSVNANSGEVTFNLNPNYEIYNSYSFEINASDAQGNKSSWATIELNINDKNDNTQVEWGQVRYILLKGEALWSYFNNIGEVDILDTNGVNLIDNGTLNVNDFTYDYANGHYSGQGGENLFDESASSAYANSQSNISIDREKWVLVDLNMSVELGALTIQARSNHPTHIERITHMTVFASDNADDFTFTTDYSGEVLMDQSTSQMKGNEAIRWRDLDEFTTTNISITYENARQQIETD